ncbi:hypothetical protein HCJ76_44205 [Streptomyces sp. MC1]|uniref:hypothetical protein n=1 Tax=Streptomyces sp. MC1 TaxID=295105 RepID=UPI0018CB9E69|nr:hypothetical protein [Streptomyces sp. MC1]MBG7704888.1 hypothetical protein [Streptomyces sp. MC1]
MMPHARARCQPNPAARRQINEPTPLAPRSAALCFALVEHEREQWIAHTASRRITRPEEWLTAVNFMVGAGFCPGAGRTTIRVAEDIAARMPGSRDGTVAYCLDRMVKRLGLSRRCITIHVSYLRALGLLVWAERGSSLRNAVRARRGEAFGPGEGFKRSATIYAPVAPRVWDEAHGRRLDGAGYTARVIGVTEDGRAQAVAEARAKQVRKRLAAPVDNSRSCTPSVQVPKPRTTDDVGGGKKDTGCGAKARPHRAKGSTGRTPQQAAWEILWARQVQLATWWTQGSCVRRLAHSLRPLFDAGWDWDQIGRELGKWNVRARPRNVAAYVTAEIRRRAHRGMLLLPDGLVRPYREAPADEQRYGAWLDQRAREFGSRYVETLPLRLQVRAVTPPGQGGGARVPRGLAEARPDQVLLTPEEFALLKADPRVPRACETLWAEAEDKAAARIEAEQRFERWEMLAPGALEHRQVYG